MVILIIGFSVNFVAIGIWNKKVSLNVVYALVIYSIFFVPCVTVGELRQDTHFYSLIHLFIF